MNKQIARSIESMQAIIEGKEAGAGLRINKIEGCIEVTHDKSRMTPMYEIADWVQFLTNHSTSKHASSDLKQLHETFLTLWNQHISQLTISPNG